MALKHSRDTIFKVNSVDLSTFTTESELPRSTDVHDVTCYGSNSHKFGAGLNEAKVTASGMYDSTASTGPRAALLAVYALNAGVAIIRQIEGAGTGKPQDSCSAIMTSYNETSPVADYVKWKAEFQVTGDITTTAQA